jgi:hypothetical protein
MAAFNRHRYRGICIYEPCRRRKKADLYDFRLAFLALRTAVLFYRALALLFYRQNQAFFEKKITDFVIFYRSFGEFPQIREPGAPFKCIRCAAHRSGQLGASA